MKKIFIPIALIALLFLSSCVSEHIINIDTFCEKLSDLCPCDIKRESLISEYDNEEIMYSCLFDDIFLRVYVNKDTMNIKKISVVCEKYSEEYLKLIENILQVLDESEATACISQAEAMLSENKKEYANIMHTLNYVSLRYVKTSLGSSFIISYNEEIPSETTSIPETAVEYTYKLNNED